MGAWTFTTGRLLAVVVCAGVMGGNVPESEATITYPLDQQQARRIQIGPGLGVTTVVSPTSPLADFDQTLNQTLGPSDGTSVSYAIATQRSILGPDQIDVRCFIEGYRALGQPLNPNVLRVVAQSVAVVSFNLSEASSFSAQYLEYSYSGFPGNVNSGMSLYRIGDVGAPELLVAFPNQLNATTYGTLQPGTYSLSVGAGINSDQGLFVGSGRADVHLILTIPGVETSTALGVGAGTFLRRRRRTDECTA